MIVNTLYDPNFIGGAERSVKALAEGLATFGNEVVIISSTSKKDYSATINNVKVYYLNTMNLYWGFDNERISKSKKTLWHIIDSFNIIVKSKIESIIDIENPDIVHTNNLSGFSVIVWDIAYKKKYKIIHTLRDYYLICPKTTMFKNDENCSEQCLSCKSFSIPKLNKSNKVDAVVGISQYILNKHLENGYFEKSKINQVIGNDVGKREKNSKPFNKSKISFGFIGQLKGSKGIDYLLSVFNNLNKFSNWELLIAGNDSTDYAQEMKNKYLNKRIQYLGEVKSQEFYKNIDVLIVPSLWQEPFGRVVLEGILNEKYVLASNKGGIPELLDNENLFDPETDELEKKIQNILNMDSLPKCKESKLVNIHDTYLSLYKKVIEN